MSPSFSLGKGLRLIAGLVFTALLVYAPLNYGSTRAGGPEIIAAGCSLGTVLWLLSALITRNRPQVPRFVLVGAGVVIASILPWALGWIEPTAVAEFTQHHFARVVARWPVSVLYLSPSTALWLSLALVVSLIPLIDLAASRAWSTTFIITLTGTATLVALLALAQNYTGAKGIYWHNDGRMPGFFCGPFYHHTSAGAFFNTAWPLSIALACVAWKSPRPVLVKFILALISSLAVVLLISAHGSHVSRFPQIAALLVLPFLLLSLKISYRRHLLLAALTVTAVVAALSYTGRLDEITRRWQSIVQPRAAVGVQANPPPSAWADAMRDDLFVQSYQQSAILPGRVEAWTAALKGVSLRPLFGHGPGNWMGASSQTSDDPFTRTFFLHLQFAHQDFLQTAVELGLIAAVAWSLLFVGALVRLIKVRMQLGKKDRLMAVAAACALGAVLLQSLIDFPLQIPAIIYNCTVLCALIWAACCRPTDQSSAQSRI